MRSLSKPAQGRTRSFVPIRCNPVNKQPREPKIPRLVATSENQDPPREPGAPQFCDRNRIGCKISSSRRPLPGYFCLNRWFLLYSPPSMGGEFWSSYLNADSAKKKCQFSS